MFQFDWNAYINSSVKDIMEEESHMWARHF